MMRGFIPRNPWVYLALCLIAALIVQDVRHTAERTDLQSKTDQLAQRLIERTVAAPQPQPAVATNCGFRSPEIAPLTGNSFVFVVPARDGIIWSSQVSNLHNLQTRRLSPGLTSAAIYEVTIDKADQEAKLEFTYQDSCGMQTVSQSWAAGSAPKSN